MIHLQLPFTPDKIERLYDPNIVRVPHPIFFGDDEASLLNTSNDLTVPERNYLFGCNEVTPLVSPAKGKLVRVYQKPETYWEYFHHSPSWRTFFSHRPAIEHHNTNFIVLETQEGLVRLEHIVTNLAKRTRVEQGEEIGMLGGYKGTPHLHVYGVADVNDKIPSQKLFFEGVPERRNISYEAVRRELQERDLDTFSTNQQRLMLAPIWTMFQAVCRRREESMEKEIQH